jgi:hypothetical protein
MYGFCRTTDLGKRVSYFSCKNYGSKVYTCFVEIVVLVPKSTAKLDLQFLDFLRFYIDFRRCSLNTQGVKKLFASRPAEDLKIHNYALHLRKSPWNYLEPCNVALGGLGWRGWMNFGDLAGGLGWGSVWEGSRVRLGPFWVLTCGGEMVGGHGRRG